MTAALLSAPWYFLAALCVFGGALIACTFAAIVGWACDNWPGDLNDPNDFGADDARDPTKEIQ